MSVLPLPSAAYLRQCFDYNSDSGDLRWRARPRRHFANEQGWVRFQRFVGTVAGCRVETAGIAVRINNRLFKASRVIWKMQTGRDPKHEVDHRNLDPYDNRWDNLRDATRVQNGQNRSRRRNHDLPKGVQRCRGKYQTAIYLKRRRVFLGVFNTITEAKAAYDTAARQHYGEFARMD
jgi:HNH endonuclease